MCSTTQFNEPLPHNGGTDAISVVNGRLYISASAPGTTGSLPAPQPTFPRRVLGHPRPVHSVATVTPVFGDEDAATVANVARPQSGQTVNAGLDRP